MMTKAEKGHTHTRTHTCLLPSTFTKGCLVMSPECVSHYVRSVFFGHTLFHCCYFEYSSIVLTSFIGQVVKFVVDIVLHILG